MDTRNDADGPEGETSDSPGVRRLPYSATELIRRRRTLPPVDPDQLRRDLAATSDDRMPPPG